MSDLTQKIAQIENSETAGALCNELYDSRNILEYVGSIMAHLLMHRLAVQQNLSHRHWAQHDRANVNSLISALFDNVPAFYSELIELIEVYNQKTIELFPDPTEYQEWVIVI